MASVCLVEDHLLLAETLAAALRSAGVTATVVTPFGSGAPLLDRVLAARPDLVLLDLDLGDDGDGVDLVAPLRAAGIRVLVVTGTSDRLRIAAALEQGALGHRCKRDGFEALLEASLAALASGEVQDGVARQGMLRELRQARAVERQTLAPFARLTDREEATLCALAEGRSARETAREWVVSETTVRSHIRGVLTKLGVTSQLEAVAVARRAGWLDRVRGKSAS